MKQKSPSKRRTYPKLGRLLKNARERIYDERTGKGSRPEDMAKQLGVTTGFAYQVEQGKRKPRDSEFGRWASVYGVRYVELWKCLDRIPMDLVASYKAQPEPDSEPVSVDPFSQLSEEEKTELFPFLEFVRWKIGCKASTDL